jgi:hypothetical protein
MTCAAILPMPPRVIRRELTCEDIAAATSDPLRQIQRRVGGWFARQLADPTLPRVRRAKLAWTDRRWSYLVDAESYSSFTARERRSPLPPAFDTDEARAGGCSCAACVVDGRRKVLVDDGCPVHRVLFATRQTG